MCVLKASNYKVKKVNHIFDKFSLKKAKDQVQLHTHPN